MLVSSGKEHDVITLHSLISCNNVSCNGAVSMPYVQLGAGIIDRSGDIKLLFCLHGDLPPWISAHSKPYYRKSKLYIPICQ